MIYLDYSATTPVSADVLDTMNKVTKNFIGNPHSMHGLGIQSKKIMDDAINQIASLFNVTSDELIFTSSSTESNNFAIVGASLAHFKKGKHIIVSKLEHASIYSICDYLKSIGFKIDYVNNDNDGLVDLEHLKSLIKDDTILVSICAVNSELGIYQPLKTIKQIIKKQNPNTLFHSDMTQMTGKIKMSVLDTDLATISSHKIYGPKGIALLYKKKDVRITPLVYGSGPDNEFKPGTPALPLIVGFSKALRLSLEENLDRVKYISMLNDKICKHLSKYEDVLINKTKYSIPHILNISVMNIKPETFIHALDEHEIYVSTNTACSSGDISNSVLSVYNDEKRAAHTLRISLSHLTTLDEIKEFLKCFDICYDKLNNLTK